MLIIANFETPPIAATSLRFTASAFHPNIFAGVHSLRKCTPSTIKSQQAIRSLPAVVWITAPSSPMPTSTPSLRPARLRSIEIISDSLGILSFCVRIVAPGASEQQFTSEIRWSRLLKPQMYSKRLFGVVEWHCPASTCPVEEKSDGVQQRQCGS